MIKILETDQLFTDSPDAGHPKCKCSRCLKVIGYEEMPLRVWPTDDHGKVMNYEYRFCNNCAGLRMVSADDF